MLIKTIADILNHQSDRFDLLLRPSYSPLFLYNAFRRFPLIPFIYFTRPTKDECKKITLQSSKTTSKLEKSTEIQTFQQKSKLSFGGFNKKS